jgi:hypothetical protein
MALEGEHAAARAARARLAAVGLSQGRVALMRPALMVAISIVSAPSSPMRFLQRVRLAGR